MKILALIPARMGSSRFPGKPMAPILGKPMIGHVYERVSRSSLLTLTAVATCDQEIYDYITSIGGVAVMTGSQHERASDRCAEALIKLEQTNQERYDIVVMVQGDEPMTHPDMIAEAVQPLLDAPDVQVVNLLGAIQDVAEFEDRNCIKVVCDLQNNALYFSREPIPTRAKVAEIPMGKQVCIIPFRRDFLLEYTRMEPTPLEIAESVDMMRVLEHGRKVKMVPTRHQSFAVDTEADRIRVEAYMKSTIDSSKGTAMAIQRKSHLAKVDRIRVSEGRNLATGLRLDRNERVDPWQKDIFERIFSEQPGYFLSVYPESTALYKKLAAFHGVSESELLLTSGIDGGLKTLYEIVTEPGDTVGVVSPTYAMYKVYANLFQVHLHETEYTAQLQFNHEDFEDFLGKKPVMFFLPNPNQPVESAFSKEQLEEFAQKTLRKNCLFVIDEAYHMFGCDSGIDLIRKYNNIVVARTFSKGFGVPSIRLGYLISNRDNMGILSKTRFAHESNSLSNAVAEYLLDNYSIVENYNRAVIAAREALKPIMQGFGISAIGRNGNFLLLDLGNQTRAKEYVTMLLAKDIYVKGPWSRPWDKYVTITIGPMVSMRRFIDATAEFVR